MTKGHKARGTFLSRPRLQDCIIYKSCNWEIPKFLAVLCCSAGMKLTLTAVLVMSASIITLDLVLPVCISCKSLCHLTPDQVPGWELCLNSLVSCMGLRSNQLTFPVAAGQKAVEVVKKERYGHWEEFLWYAHHLAPSFCPSHSCPWTKWINLVWHHSVFLWSIALFLSLCVIFGTSALLRGALDFSLAVRSWSHVFFWHLQNKFCLYQLMGHEVHVGELSLCNFIF